MTSFVPSHSWLVLFMWSQQVICMWWWSYLSKGLEQQSVPLRIIEHAQSHTAPDHVSPTCAHRVFKDRIQNIPNGSGKMFTTHGTNTLAPPTPHDVSPWQWKWLPHTHVPSSLCTNPIRRTTIPNSKNSINYKNQKTNIWLLVSANIILKGHLQKRCNLLHFSLT